MVQRVVVHRQRLGQLATLVLCQMIGYELQLAQVQVKRRNSNLFIKNKKRARFTFTASFAMTLVYSSGKIIMMTGQPNYFTLGLIFFYFMYIILNY